MIPDATGQRDEPNGVLAVEGQGLDTTTSDTSAKRHFDAFETDFFQQGDDSAKLLGDSYLVEDVDTGGGGRRPLLSRSTLLGLTALSSALALVACLALWHSQAPVVAPLITLAPPASAAPADTVSIPSGAALVAASPPPASTGAPVLGELLRSEDIATDEPESKGGEGKVAMPATVAESAPAATVAEEETTPESTSEAAATEEAAPQNVDSMRRCTESIRKRNNRRVLALCPAAFAEDGSDANVAVALAKAELDRGHFAQASSWSRKALAINPKVAEAYVFAGGAEQNQGHRKAAKRAYLQYLRLAPSGRYAAELRTIVGSL